MIGDLEVARRTCVMLADRGYAVAHLLRPSDADIAAALKEPVDAVAVLVRGDVTSLRYALLVEHLVPNVRLVVTLFDRTVSEQVMRAVPNCIVTSPADIAVPPIIEACLGSRVHDSRGRALGNLLLSQLRPHDLTTRILLAGLLGLFALLCADSTIAVITFHESLLRGIDSAASTIATVGPSGATQRAPGWYFAFSSLSILMTIGLTALVTAALVNRLRSTRSVSLVGRRTLPTRDHVIVIGLGQVGLRLCLGLRQLGIPVLAVERDPRAANLRLAKQARVPVLIAHAEDRAVLDRLGLHHARALATMSADGLENLEVAITALSVCHQVRIVLRAGEDDAITESRSLFRIGEVCDVSALTTTAVTERITTPYDPRAACPEVALAMHPDPPAQAIAARCSCS